MSVPVSITLSHQLGRAEARRRIENGFANIAQTIPGATTTEKRWEGDRLDFGLAAMGQRIGGRVDVQDHSVTIAIHLSGVFGILARGFKAQLQKVGQLMLTKR